MLDHRIFNEQQAIVDILSAADKEINLFEQELADRDRKKIPTIITFNWYREGVRYAKKKDSSGFFTRLKFNITLKAFL